MMKSIFNLCANGYRAASSSLRRSPGNQSSNGSSLAASSSLRRSSGNQNSNVFSLAASSSIRRSSGNQSSNGSSLAASSSLWRSSGNFKPIASSLAASASVRRYSGNLNPNASYLSASSSIVKYRRVMGNIVANRSLFSSSYIGHYPRNEFTEDYLVEILEKKIELAESKGVGKAVIEGGIHATIVKMGLKSDRIKGKLIRFVGALGYTSAAETLFLECSTFAGVGVCNALIAALGIGGRGAEAINVLHHMPNKLVKTETTYWNVLVACSHSGEAKAANYILGKIYKKLSMEPAIHHVGTYIDALARKGELVHAVREVKCLLYTPNREIIVSILGRCQPTFFDEPEVAKAFAKYLESKGISYRIQKSLYRELGAIGVQWGSNVKILRQRRIGGSSPN